jgi:hypothetical protein
MLLSVVHKNNALSQGGAPFAGSVSGESGTADGTGSNARFNAPSHIVADGSGSFYISDSGNHTIRKVDQFGVVTTVFGTAGTSGSSLTTLNSPRGLALDASNNLYIADFSNSRVLRLAYGESTATNLGTVYGIDEIAVNSNGSEAVFRTNRTSGLNLIQFRNGTIEGTISINIEAYSFIYQFNVATVACSPSGIFYYSATDGQLQGNQISMYNMSLSPPTTYNFTASTGVVSINGNQTPFVGLDANPVTTGVTAGLNFTLSGFTNPKLNGFVGVVKATYTSPNPSNGFSIDFSGFSNDYPIGPVSSGTIENSYYNSTSKFQVLGFGWDTAGLFAASSNPLASPLQELRMNIYIKDVKYAFQEVPFSPTVTTTTEESTTFLKSFTGDFTAYNNFQFSGLKIYDWPIGSTYEISGNLGLLSNVHNYSGIGSSNIQLGFVGSKVVGPNVELGTIVTSYSVTGQDGNSGTFTTNKPFIFTSKGTIGFTLIPENSNVHKYVLSSNAVISVGSVLSGKNADGAVITEVIPDLSNALLGTITTEETFQSEEEVTYIAEPAYKFYPWIGSSTRLVSVVFPTVTFPTDSGTCRITTINNNPTAMSIDGALYGGSIKNMQFSKTDSSTFFASSFNYSGIRRYGVSGNSISMIDSNSNVPTLNPFAVFPTTSEMVALVPTPASNNIQIYQNVY